MKFGFLINTLYQLILKAYKDLISFFRLPVLGIWTYIFGCYLISILATLFSKYSTVIAEFTTWEQTICLLNLTLVISVLPLTLFLSNLFSQFIVNTLNYNNTFEIIKTICRSKKQTKIADLIISPKDINSKNLNLEIISLSKNIGQDFYTSTVVSNTLVRNGITELEKNLLLSNNQSNWRTKLLIKEHKISTNLNTKTISEISESHTDLLSLSFGYSWNVDFVTPASAEFRGIIELYHLVMYQLLFVFFFLIVAAFLALQAYLDKTKVFERLMRPAAYVYHNEKIVDQNGNEHLVVVPSSLEVQTQKFNKWVSSAKYFAASSGSIFWVYFSALEFIWTLVPCLILLFISLPSFTLALALDEAHKPAAWIKVIGNQWFWVYEYSTYNENIAIFSNIVQGGDLNDQALRLLEPDSTVTISLNKFTRFLVTSSDVIHSWAVPAMGVKIDACPGRINAVSILPTRAGIYYGQCSEICGINHAFMPICVEVVA